MNTRERLMNYIRSGHAGIYVVSAEETRVAAELKAVADAISFNLYTWATTSGLIDVSSGRSVSGCNDPMEAVQTVADMKEGSIVVLNDFHLFLQDVNPVLIRAIKDSLVKCKSTGISLVIVGCRQVLPPELEREFVVVNFDLPGKDALGQVLDGICDSAKIKKLKGDERESVLDAAGGLTSIEAENCFALSVVETKGISGRVITREKSQTVKKNGLLEIIEAKEKLEDVGGLDVLKDWLLKRREAFTSRATQYGLPSPKGVLIVGVPGTGKSLTAKATAAVFGRPLLKLDAGRLFGSLVGQSEDNLRKVINTAEAISPCVLWVDEIEKGFSGTGSSGSTDGGTSARVFGSFISWMQEKKSPVFIVATANDVSKLPPELLRKGRFDESWFVDLPTEAEREIIWRIQISRLGRKPGDYDLKALAKQSDGYTGAEIEQGFIDALYAGFADNKEPTTASVSQAVSATVPLSKLMAEQISGLRKWSQGRARPATSVTTESTLRKIAA